MCTKFDEAGSPSKDDEQEAPESLVSHKIVCDPSNNGLYLVGGWKSGRYVRDNFVREVWKFNFSTRKWRQLKSEQPPSTLANHTLARLDNRRLLVYGGSLLGRGDALGNNNETYLYDTDCQLWTKLQTTGQACPTPSKHWFGQAMCLDGHRLYAVTGRRQNSGAKLLVHMLDLNRLSWSYLSLPETEPAGRVRHEILAHDGRLFVFGGAQCSFERSYPLNTITCFDPRSSTWVACQTVPDAQFGFPGARTCHTVVPYDRFAYLSGGYCIGDDTVDPTSKSLDDFWRFEPASLKWTRLPGSLPCPLWSHAADVTSEGWMYIYGGCTTKKQRSSAMYKICLDVPKLETLAWCKVTGYVFSETVPSLSNHFIDKLTW